MRDLKKSTYNLRCKSSSGLQQARPKGTNAGNCVVCGRYMEERRSDDRCGTLECEKLLKKLCIDRGLGIQIQDGIDTWTFIKISDVLSEGKRQTQDVVDHNALDNHTCSCKRGLKLPKADVCACCYREHNVKSAKKRRKKMRKKAKQFNGIRGLGNLKIG